VTPSRPRRWLLDKASYSDGYPAPSEFAGGWVSAAKTRSGRVIVSHADRRILVKSEHIYLIIEGKAPAWLTLHAPASGDDKNLLDRDDIRETGAGEFVDWSIHIHGDKRTVIYVLGGYSFGPECYEAYRVD
jgi:hypothetical protein